MIITKQKVNSVMWDVLKRQAIIKFGITVSEANNLESIEIDIVGIPSIKPHSDN